MWIRDATIGLVISYAWHSFYVPPNLSQFMSELKSTKVALKKWNIHHFKNVPGRIKELKHIIETCQSSSQSNFIMEQEASACKELDETLVRERLLWKSKAKARWLEEGNANTHFFHVTTLSHRRSNHIHSIFSDANIRVSNPDSIGQVFVDYYANLFQSAPHLFPADLQDLILPTMNIHMNSSLTAMPDALEIRASFQSMHNSKSPGPDGMSPLFYKSFWNVISPDVIHAI